MKQSIEFCLCKVDNRRLSREKNVEKTKHKMIKLLLIKDRDFKNRVLIVAKYYLRRDRLMNINNHFGIYGVCFKDNKLLCIEKNAGPYKGRFDLPGGSQENNEGLTETLVREILEETGFTLLSYSNPRIYDVFVREEEKKFMVHHIMVFYDIEIDWNIEKQTLPSLVADGMNDSDAEVWIDLDEIHMDNSSPLVLKVKQELLGTAKLDKEIYNNWKVNC